MRKPVQNDRNLLGLISFPFLRSTLEKGIRGGVAEGGVSCEVTFMVPFCFACAGNTNDEKEGGFGENPRFLQPGGIRPTDSEIAYNSTVERHTATSTRPRWRSLSAF